MALAPREQGVENRYEFLAPLGQQVLGARRMLLVEAAFDLRLFQSLQAGRQRVGAEFLKFARSETLELL
jgi:hypothetical protein